jgi:hypothetical protein
MKSVAGWAATGLLLAAVTGTVVAADPVPARPDDTTREASIPFANHGAIRDWEVVDDSTLLIQDIHGQWYRAKLSGPAFALPYTEHLGFVTEPSGTLEKLSAVVVRGQRYAILSLTRSNRLPARNR